MQRLEFYPVIGVKGGVEKVPASPGKDIGYEDITRLVGSPFDNVILIREPGLLICAYIRDEGLFDGSEPNLPLCGAGLPICGPVMLTGGASPSGNTLPPPDHEYVTVMMQSAEVLADSFRMIEEHRANPFTVEFIDVTELAARLAAAEEASNAIGD